MVALLFIVACINSSILATNSSLDKILVSSLSLDSSICSANNDKAPVIESVSKSLRIPAVPEKPRVFLKSFDSTEAKASLLFICSGVNPA